MSMSMGFTQRPVQRQRLKCNYCIGYLDEHEAKCQFKEMERLENERAENAVICPKCRNFAYPNARDYFECPKCHVQYSTSSLQEDVGERVFLEYVRNMGERSLWAITLPDKGSSDFPYDKRIREVQERMLDNPLFKEWEKKQEKKRNKKVQA